LIDNCHQGNQEVSIFTQKGLTHGLWGGDGHLQYLLEAVINWNSSNQSFLIDQNSYSHIEFYPPPPKETEEDKQNRIPVDKDLFLLIRTD